MKKKNIIIIIIFLIILVIVGLNITTRNSRINKMLEKMNNTSKIIIGYNEETYNLEDSFQSDGEKYSVVAHITDKEKIEEIIKIYNDASVTDGVSSFDSPKYLLRFLDKKGNLLLEASYCYLKDNNIENIKLAEEKQLESIIKAYILLDIDCVKQSLLALIMTESNTPSIIDIKEITNRLVEYNEVIKTNDNNIYAIIKTKDNEVIKDFNNYFKKNYQGYKTLKLNNDFIVYVYNKNNDYNLLEVKKCENN